MNGCASTGESNAIDTMEDARSQISGLAGQLAKLVAKFGVAKTDGDCTAIWQESSPKELGHALASVLDQMMGCIDCLPSSNVPVLSVQQLRVVYTSIEILWNWRIKPEVAHLGNFELPIQPLPNSILITAKAYKQSTDHHVIQPSLTELLRLTMVMKRVITNEIFSGLMLPRNLDRVLVTLFLLAFATNTLPSASISTGDIETVRASAQTEIDSLKSSAFLPMVVTKLRSFTRGPAWLRDASLRLFSDILQGEGGLEVVLSGYLEGTLEGAHAEALQAHVAKLVTTAPVGADSDAFLRNVARQAKQLLLYGLFKDDKTLMRVCALITTRLAIVTPALCDTEILQPLLAPLTPVVRKTYPWNAQNKSGVEQAGGDLEPSGNGSVECLLSPSAQQRSVYWPLLYPPDNRTVASSDQAATTIAALSSSASGSGITTVQSTQAVVTARELSAAVEMVHTLLTICPVHSALVAALVRLRAIDAMFLLYAHVTASSESGGANSVHGSAGPSSSGRGSGRGSGGSAGAAVQALTAAAEEVCLIYLRHQGTKAASLLQRLCLSQIKAGQTEANDANGANQFCTNAFGEVEIRHCDSTRGNGGVESSPPHITIAGVIRADMDHSADEVPVPTASSVVQGLLVLLNKLEERYQQRLLYEQQRAETVSSTATAGSATTTAPSSSSAAAAKNTPVSGPGSEKNMEGVRDLGYEYLASELFLWCLSGFLQLGGGDVGAPSSEHVAVGNERAAEAGQVGETRVPTASRQMYGVLLLQFQEALSLTALLRDGVQILRLLKAFLEHYAQELQERREEAALADAGTTTTAPVSTAMFPAVDAAPTQPPQSTRILIQVIGESNEDAETANASDSPAQDDRTVSVNAVSRDNGLLIDTVLSLLAGILGMGQQQRSAEEEELLCKMLPALQSIAFCAQGVSNNSTEESDIAQAASDVALMILSRSYHSTHPTSSTAPPGPDVSAGDGREKETFMKVLGRMKGSECLFSDSPAMRGYGLRILQQYVQRRPTSPSKAITAVEVEEALSVLFPLLIDTESFVYLHALMVIRALGEHQPVTVFRALLQSYASADDAQLTGMSRVVVVGKLDILPQSRRAMVGEALGMLLRRVTAQKTQRPAVHQQVVQVLPALVAVCLRLARQRLALTDVESVEETVDLVHMRIRDSTSNAADADVSADAGTQMHDSRSGQQQELQHQQQQKIAAAALAADEVILRQSAVALLAEAVTAAGAGAYRYLNDVLDVAVGVLTMEVAFTGSARAARRSAAYLAARAVLSVQSTITAEQLLLPEAHSTATASLQRAYEVLQRTALSDVDVVVVHHASQGVFAIQEMFARVYEQSMEASDVERDVDGRRELYKKLDFRRK